MGTELEMEARPQHGWLEVPPTSKLDGVNLITEGVVTMSKALERMAGIHRVRDLPRQEDGATRLARRLLTADKICFLIGRTINPAQTADEAGNVSMRQVVIEQLIRDLESRRKIISIEYF
jgi:hypothetical protein